YWWWPDRVGEFYESSMKHSHTRTLPEVEAVLKTALDVRRLAKYIAAFPDAPASIALLYPRASLVQKFPGAVGHKTPYTLEVEKTYEAAVMLDTPVGFVSSKQAKEGIPQNYRIIVVPGCRYVEADVFDSLRSWVEAGGTLVVTPTSFIADEYNRRRGYLDALGIQILGEELPEFMAGEAKRGIDQSGELDFIQGPIAKTVISKEPSRRIVTDRNALFTGRPRTLNAAGVIQQVKPSDDWNIAARYEGEDVPAILSRRLGKGSVYYLAAQLDLPSRRMLFDRLLELSGTRRPIRVFTQRGGYPEGVESRTVYFEGGLLTYLNNRSSLSVPVSLHGVDTKTMEIWNVSADRKERSPRMTLAPYETRIIHVREKKPSVDVRR
ncbi:MAG TPA: hypothetical protein ENN09_01070, partial [Planctomycetes bacterium]|nr:hypothetical protein [Planctomycetota bacterium]